MHELHVDSITKTYGHAQILNGVYLSCRPGEIIGLVGRNGSGKSTLLEIIFGSLAADNKFVRIDGQQVNSGTGLSKDVAYLPQHSFLPSHLTFRNIIQLFTNRHSLENVLREEHVQPFLSKKPSAVSGGQRRMIEILLILHQPAKYMLMDEPLSSIEPVHKNYVMRRIQSHANDKGFIITGHDHPEILAVATKILLLKNGTAREIKNRGELVTLGYLPDTSPSGL